MENSFAVAQTVGSLGTMEISVAPEASAGLAPATVKSTNSDT
jgi:hypothetical protein